MSVKVSRLLGSKFTSKSLAITYPSAKETTPGSPLTVPASEPADYTWTYTIESGDIPTYSTGSVITDSKVALVCCGGQNLNAGSQTINYRILKNDVSQATGSYAVSNNNYYCIHFRTSGLIGVAVNDVIKVRLWASSASYFDCKFYDMRIGITRAKISNADYMYNIDYIPVALPAFSNTTQNGLNELRFYNTGTDTTQYYSASVSTGKIYGIKQNTAIPYYAWRVGPSDINSTTQVMAGASAVYYIDNGYFVNSLSWEE